ncbi:MAG: beta-galactosidase [Opitutaceae bacterium]
MNPASRPGRRRYRPRHQRPAPFDRFLFGVSYYPEQEPRRRWKQDFARMRRSGVQVVRMGEFAWDVWEPRRGVYSFELFDAAITLAAEQGLKVLLGTPTAAPPRWLSIAHPEWLRHTADGRPVDHTGRQHIGPVHEGFRAICRELTTALAAHYASVPAVIGWQIDNELHCVGSLDFSPGARRAFQSWLTRRYRRIEVLNTRWGTAFSAQTYASFEEIPLPLVSRPDGYPPHPGHLLDFHRFSSEVTVAFAAEQSALLRNARARWLIFHNGLFAHLDYWKLSDHLDLLGVDLYPGFGGSDGVKAGAWAAFKLQQCRAHSGAYLVPELATGAAGSQRRFLETPEPGQMRLWAWQCIAHGAVGLIHFRWRTCRFGQEIYWHGILDHDSRPRRRLAEFAQESREIARVEPWLSGAVRDTRIGVLIESEQDDAHAGVLECFPAPRHQAEHLLGALLARHLPAGLIHARDSFRGLSALILPSFGHVSSALAARLEAFVQRGGLLIATARCGTRDGHNQALTRTAPGPLAALMGATVEEVGGLRTPLLSFVPTGGDPILAQPGYELLHPRTAASVACWTMTGVSASRQAHPAHGAPAATLRPVGRGRALLVGAWITAENAAPIVAWLGGLAGWRPLVTAGPGIEVSRLITARGSLLFLLNHTAEPQRVTDLAPARDLLTRRSTGDAIDLPAFGVAVLSPR